MESVLNGLRDRLDRVKPYAPYVLTALFAVFISAITCRHEMWRDELQAWLLARDAPTPWSIFSIIKYEGHPGLWHLILWPFAHVSWNPAWMQAAHIAIISAAVFILYRYSPFPWPIKLLISYGYYFAYEWAVISRNYAISVLLLFIICTCWEQKWKRPLLLGALVFLLCHTNVYSIIISMVLFAGLCFEYVVNATWQGNAEPLRRRMAAAGCCIMLLGLLTGIVQVIPPTDSGTHTEWHFNPDKARMVAASRTVVHAYLPMPIKQTAFWNTNRFIDKSGDSIIQMFFVSNDQVTPFALCILIAGCIFLASRPRIILPYLAGTAGLLAFYYTKFAIGPRHYGFLFLIFICAAWISYYYPERKSLRPLAGWERFRTPLLGLVLLVHVWGTITTWRVDWRETFSAGKEAASWLERAYPDRTGLLLAGNRASTALTVLGYLQAEQMFYPDRNDFGSYIIFDNRRTTVDDQELIRRIKGLMSAAGKPVLLVSNRAIPGVLLPPGCRLLKSFNAGTVCEEGYHIYFFRNSRPVNHATNTTQHYSFNTK